MQVFLGICRYDFSLVQRETRNTNKKLYCLRDEILMNCSLEHRKGKGKGIVVKNTFTNSVIRQELTISTFFFCLTLKLAEGVR